MSKIRLGILFTLFFLFGAGILLRLFSLQITQGKFYQAKSAALATRPSGFTRGNIFIQDKDGNLYIVAETKRFLRLYAVPSKIPAGKEEEVANFLGENFAIPPQTLTERLSRKDDIYEPLKEGIFLDQKIAIEEQVKEFEDFLKLEEYSSRFYPYQSLASHVIGFVGFEGAKKVGLYGIEKAYDGVLARGDDDVVLTIDISLQEQSEKMVKELVERFKANEGSIVIMNPRDGRILAMASKPDFDINTFSEVEDIAVFLNPVLQKVFEPGSIIKPITMAAGLETGKITPQTSYVDTGFSQKGGYIIKNAGERVFGKRTMAEVLEFSINTGAIFVQEQVGQKDFLDTFERFGFGEKTGIDLPGELGGDITNLDSGRVINYATASFGQGISATPLQVLSAVGAIANEGKLMRPFLVQEILSGKGEQKTKPNMRRQVISPGTAAQLEAMMVEVVEKGYSKKAQVPGYLVAGKTGTSQVPSAKGGYLDTTIHSFVGFAPAFDPRFIILIKLDAPMGIRFASESIAPYFSRLAQYALQYYGIFPEKSTSE